MAATITKIKIEKGVLDLLFKQLKTGHWCVSPLLVFLPYMLRENIQFEVMAIWAGLFFIYLLISDVFFLRTYGHRWKEVEDNHKWFLSLAVHNFIFSCFLASLPLLCEANIDQLIIVLVGIIVCTLILGGCALLSVHITSCFSWSIPLIIGLYLFIARQNNSDFQILTFYSVLTLVAGIIFALNSRRFIYASVESNLKNEELVEQLREEQKIAAKAIEDKTRFLASASHDLRQPLHALGLFVETLGEKTKDEDDKALIKNINQATGALQELFNALLDISRLDAGVVEANKESFFINDLLIQINNEFQTVAEEKGIQLNTQESNAAVYSDKLLTERILRNLISNAVKYTNEGSINITIKKEPEKVFVKIIDTGVGIPENEQENIFSEFYQIDNPERDRSKGLGLGLSIVKRLTELLSLKLIVKSNDSNGTNFTIEFPAGNVEKISRENVETKNVLNNFDGMHALVIDDEKDILDGMNIILGKWGFKVSLSESIEAAMDVLVGEETPDIILSDLRLRNNTTGIEAIQKIRTLANKEIPALLVSGDTAPNKIKEAQAAGVILLHKPVKAALLKTAINNLFSKNI